MRSGRKWVWLVLLWVGAMQGARGAAQEAGLTVQAADGSSQVLAATQTEVAIEVAVGDRTVGGESVLARWPSAAVGAGVGS